MTQIYLVNIYQQINKEDVSYFLRHISEDNKKRYKNFRFREDALRMLYGEVVARCMISEWLKIQNNEIKINKTECGKPYVEGRPVHFNISHSGDWVAVAISDESVGVDIEQVKDIDIELVKKVLHKKEQNYLKNKTGIEQLHAFYDIWTLKESYVKWLGTGMTGELHKYGVCFSENEISMVGLPEKSTPFFMQYSIDGYKLSVCLRSNIFPRHFNVLDIRNLKFC